MKNKVLTGLLLVLIGGWGSLSAQSAGSNYSRQVNTLIGTKGVGLTSGYLYPGATYPYGMVQFTPSYFSKRSGFVINQLSGGGCEHMGNFPTFPVKGKLKMSPDNILNYRINISEEKGHAGYYEAMVQEDIKAKLTVSDKKDLQFYRQCPVIAEASDFPRTFPNMSKRSFSLTLIGAYFSLSEIRKIPSLSFCNFLI